MTKTTVLRLSALAFSLCLAGVAAAQSGALARADRDFLERAAHGGAAEIEASKLAQTKAASSEVKQFAKQMVADHTKAGEALKQLAKAKGVQLPAEPSLAQKARIRILSARDGANFDQDYAEDVGVKAHGDMAKLFQKAAQEAQDPDVKAFAQKTLPTVQHHLQMAQSLHTQLSARTATPRGGAMTGSGTSASAASK